MVHQDLLTVGLILLLHPAFLGSDKVQSYGGIVRLPCTYTVHKWTHSVCWGRGLCPVFGCNDGIINTEGDKVTWRKSDKYQILGNIDQGDVTLSIIGATEEDAGTYCCRVAIPGLFNDIKRNIYVNKEHVEEDADHDDDDMNGPRVALVFVPLEPEISLTKVILSETEVVTERSFTTIIRVTIICSLAFVPLLIYRCIIKTKAAEKTPIY
ncbi:hepatitis A virus cellular receptor 1 homolog isoform X2 [Dendrobates tinctorius]|uniref:hepatitis A virus cellular receptor 1 homolog isoform X2 n=1 Tax=Dendrobates tinctorius TaxID=92724 RepID=UPI003CC9D642